MNRGLKSVLSASSIALSVAVGAPWAFAQTASQPVPASPAAPSIPSATPAPAPATPAPAAVADPVVPAPAAAAPAPVTEARKEASVLSESAPAAPAAVVDPAIGEPAAADQPAVSAVEPGAKQPRRQMVRRRPVFRRWIGR